MVSMVDLMFTYSINDFHFEDLSNENDLLLFDSKENNSFELLLELSLIELSTLMVRCWAHMLQLCILKGLKTVTVQNIKEKARKIIKYLSTPKTVAIIKVLKL